MQMTKNLGFFQKIYDKYVRDETKEEINKKNLELAQANIAIDYLTYKQGILNKTILGFIICLGALLVFYNFVPNIYTLTLLVVLPFLISLSVWYFLKNMPGYIIKRRERNIDLFLPYAVNFISSMSVAGVSPAEIFQSLSAINMYGEIKIEAKKIAKEITIMGTDNITALKNAIDISPSKKFRSFIQGIVGTIQSGSDLHAYLSNVAEKYMNEDLVERKKDLEVLSIIVEVFVISVIAFPIFLVIILTIMGFFGGSMTASLMTLTLFSFVILPVAYTGFYMLIKSTSLEEINRVHAQKNKFELKKLKQNKQLLVVLASIAIIGVFYLTTHILSINGFLENSIYLVYDVIFLTVILIIGPIGLYSYRQVKIKKEIQMKLPEFLTEIGDTLSTGMTIFEAIKVTEKGHYGELKSKITKMKTQLSWNVSVKEVFNDFAEKMKSAIISRVVVTINRGLLMGGSTPKVFKAAAKEVDQINQLEEQRKQNMSIYTIVIVLCFFVFLAIILILNNTVFNSFLSLGEANGVSAMQGGMLGGVNTVDPMQLKYVLFSFVFVQSIGAGVLSGFMMDGKISSGVRISCVLGLISFLTFKLLF